MNWSAKRRTNRVSLALEPLEGRALLSAAGVKPPQSPSSALTAHRPVPKILINPGAEQAIIRALFGGAGHEWIALLKSEKN